MSWWPRCRRRLADCDRLLADRIVAFENHARRSDDLNSRLYREVISSRMRPFRDGVQGFPRLVRDLARQLGKKAHLEIVGEMTEVDREILEKLDAPLNHLFRNALDHGLEPPEQRARRESRKRGRLRLEARHVAGMLSITLDGRRPRHRSGAAPPQGRRAGAHDGRHGGPHERSGTAGVPLPARILHRRQRDRDLRPRRGPGRGPQHGPCGRRAGAHRDRAGQGTRFHLQLPVTLSVIRAVIVQIAGEPYAFPHNRIDRLVRIARGDLRSLEDRQYFELDGQNIGIVLARQVLQLPIEDRAANDCAWCCSATGAAAMV